jgi:UDP-N-acetylmuramoyl-tripeptide--D-alanyl-D-alanine ligase
MNMKTAAALMNANIANADAFWLSSEINHFATDSRTVEAGDLFFAATPENYKTAGFNSEFADAHDYIEDAFSKGAVAAVAVESRVKGDEKLEALRSHLLLVADTIAAMQRLAHGVYESWGKKVVAITGSIGKTTTRELTASVLSAAGNRVLKSEKNYNTGLGLPLTVLRMVSANDSPDNYDLAVLEMGMSTPTHEIARLCAITPPDVSVITLITNVHIEHLGTIENIATAKAEAIENLKPDGTAVLNADDFRVAAMREKHKGKVLTFGIENKADVTAKEIDTNQFGRVSFVLATPTGEAKVDLHLPGRHNVMNALAAATVGVAFGLSAEKIAEGLNATIPADKRGEVYKFQNGFELIDDSYNSNPRSLLSVVQAMCEGGAHAKRKILVAGEMLELGTDAAKIHAEVGAEIAKSGIDIFWGVRGFAKEMIEGAIENGFDKNATRLFENSDEAANALIEEAREGDLILVKGSRGVRTDKVVQTMIEGFVRCQ